MQFFDVNYVGVPVLVPMDGQFTRKGYRVIPVLAAGSTPAQMEAAYTNLVMEVTRNSDARAQQGLPQGVETVPVAGPDWHRSPGFGTLRISSGLNPTTYRVWVATDCMEIIETVEPYMPGATPGTVSISGGGTLTTSSENQNFTAAAPTVVGDGVSVAGAKAIRMFIRAATAAATLNAAGQMDGYYRSNNVGVWVRCPELDYVPSVPTTEPMAQGQQSFPLPIGADRVQWVANGLTASAGTQIIRTVEVFA